MEYLPPSIYGFPLAHGGSPATENWAAIGVLMAFDAFLFLIVAVLWARGSRQRRGKSGPAV